MQESLFEPGYDLPRPRKIPIGKIYIRFPEKPQYSIPFYYKDTLQIIYDSLQKEFHINPKNYHYLTKTGFLDESMSLSDFQIVDQSIILVTPKDLFKKKEVKARNYWIQKKKSGFQSNLATNEKKNPKPKIIRPKISNHPTKNFY